VVEVICSGEHHEVMSDEDLLALDRDALVAEVVRLRAAIREHRDSSGHDLCWYHPALWSTLPEWDGSPPAGIAVPPWPQFMRGCVAYRTSLDVELSDSPVHEAELDQG
jgi:hypothetical protein